MKHPVCDRLSELIEYAYLFLVDWSLMGESIDFLFDGSPGLGKNRRDHRSNFLMVIQLRPGLSGEAFENLLYGRGRLPITGMIGQIVEIDVAQVAVVPGRGEVGWHRQVDQQEPACSCRERL